MSFIHQESIVNYNKKNYQLAFTRSDIDIEIAPTIIKALSLNLQRGSFKVDNHHYDEYYQSIKRWFYHCYATDIDTTQIVNSPSTHYLINQLIKMWSHVGDGVAIFTPAEDTFYKSIVGNQRQIVPCSLVLKNDQWYCNFAKLEAVLALPTTRLLLISNPHMPTGKSWNKQELTEIIDICQRHQVRIISDESYMDLVLYQQNHIPLAKIATGYWASVHTPEVSFNLSGLAESYGLINHKSTHEFFTYQRNECDGLSSPSMLAIIATINAYNCVQWLEEFKTEIENNFAYFAEEINNSCCSLNWQPPQAGYFAWIDLRTLGVSDIELQTALLEKHNIHLTPGYMYGDQGVGCLLFNIACTHEKLKLGLAGLINVLSNN